MLQRATPFVTHGAAFAGGVLAFRTFSGVTAVGPLALALACLLGACFGRWFSARRQVAAAVAHATSVAAAQANNSVVIGGQRENTDEYDRRSDVYYWPSGDHHDHGTADEHDVIDYDDDQRAITTGRPPSYSVRGGTTDGLARSRSRGVRNMDTAGAPPVPGLSDAELAAQIIAALKGDPSALHNLPDPPSLSDLDLRRVDL